MPKGILEINASDVNKIEICTNKINHDALTVNDVMENIFILLRYIISKSKGRRNMKKDWEIKTLGEICEVVGGGTPKTAVSEYWSDDVVWVTPKDLGLLETSEITDSAKHISLKGLEKSSAKLLPAGSVVMSSRAPIGYVAIAGVELATNQGCRNFICGNEIFNKFLYYFLFANTELLNSLGGGTTFKEISGSIIKKISIPLPPISEQKRIVKILDEKIEAIEKLKEVTEEQLVDVEELFVSKVSELFSKQEKWKSGSLSGVCTELFAGGDVPKGNHSKVPNEKHKIPIFSNGEKNKGLYGYTNKARVTEPSLTISARGTIGYSEVRNEPFYPAVRLIVVTPDKEKISLDFLQYFVKTLDFTHSGTSIPQLTVPMLRDYKISYPSILEQKKIVKQLDSLSEKTQELKSLYKVKLSDLEELKKSYLEQAFAGKL